MAKPTFEEFIQRKLAQRQGGQVPQQDSPDVPQMSPMAQAVLDLGNQKPGERESIGYKASLNSSDEKKNAALNQSFGMFNLKQAKDYHSNQLERIKAVEDENKESGDYNEKYFGDKTRKEHNVPKGFGYNPISDSMDIFEAEPKEVPKMEKDEKVPYIPSSPNETLDVTHTKAEAAPKAGGSSEKRKGRNFKVEQWTLQQGEKPYIDDDPTKPNLNAYKPDTKETTLQNATGGYDINKAYASSDYYSHMVSASPDTTWEAEKERNWDNPTFEKLAQGINEYDIKGEKVKDALLPALARAYYINKFPGSKNAFIKDDPQTVIKDYANDKHVFLGSMTEIDYENYYAANMKYIRPFVDKNFDKLYKALDKDVRISFDKNTENAKKCIAASLLHYLNLYTR